VNLRPITIGPMVTFGVTLSKNQTVANRAVIPNGMKLTVVTVSLVMILKTMV